MQWTRHLAAQGVPVVTPLESTAENPAFIGDRTWVAYPWIEGRPYAGSISDIAAAGRLLGRMHAACAGPEPGLPLFEWPSYESEEVEADIAELERVLTRRAPALAGETLTRTAAWHRTFTEATLPQIQGGGLPYVGASTDFKANNLVYTARGPVFIDPDNADYAPRLIDLALAALLFHNEHPSAPPRLFTEREWAAFARAYAEHVALSQRERELWPVALRYVITEWGTWTLVDADKSNDWSDPHKHAFLSDLAQVSPARFSSAAFTLDHKAT